MNRRHFLASLSALAATHLALAGEKPSREGQNNDLNAFASETNQFGYDLFQRLRTSAGNLFFSPYSISSCLAMAAVGARGNTAQQMAKVLRLSPDQQRYSNLHAGLMKSVLDNSKGYKISIANAMWGQEAHPFQKDYTNLVQSLYRAEARSMDFKNKAEECRGTINRWVETQTNDLIKDLLPGGSIKADTKLVLTNAIYFKGDWSDPFEKRWTKPHDFHVSESSVVKSDMMYKVDNLRYAETSDVQAVELPYKGNRLSMMLILPLKKHCLSAIEGNISSETIQKLDKNWQRPKVMLTLPKIKTNYAAMLKSTLAGMGMSDAFSFGKADFSGVDGTNELFISDVVHKAFCEVNEVGTEAAGATGVVKRTGSAAPRNEPEPKVFKADHPYLYLIRDMQTGSVLFLGRVSDPRS
jgi:serpin B